MRQSDRNWIAWRSHSGKHQICRRFRRPLNLARQRLHCEQIRARWARRPLTELLFLVQGGIHPDDTTPIDELVHRQFATGQNVYVSEFEDFVTAALVLFAEVGRRDFLLKIGECLDASKADLSDREHWRDLLQGI